MATVFDKLWFQDVHACVADSDLEIEYNNQRFTAHKKYDKTTRFVIEVTKSTVTVKIPIQQEFEYTTTFHEWYRAVDYILYHLNEYKENGKVVQKQKCSFFDSPLMQPSVPPIIPTYTL